MGIEITQLHREREAEQSEELSPIADQFSSTFEIKEL